MTKHHVEQATVEILRLVADGPEVQMGSGFYINKSGIIVTTQRVFEQCEALMPASVKMSPPFVYFTRRDGQRLKFARIRTIKGAPGVAYEVALLQLLPGPYTELCAPLTLSNNKDLKVGTKIGVCSYRTTELFKPRIVTEPMFCEGTIIDLSYSDSNRAQITNIQLELPKAFKGVQGGPVYRLDDYNVIGVLDYPNPENEKASPRRFDARPLTDLQVLDLENYFSTRQ